jgi:hypothetical protein
MRIEEAGTKVQGRKEQRMAKARKTKRAATGKRAVRDLGVKGKSGNVRGGDGILSLIKASAAQATTNNTSAMDGATKQSPDVVTKK